MEEPGLFDIEPTRTHEPTEADVPLAVAMRPRTLDDLVGQQHLLGAGSPLRRLVNGDSPMSVILWGPPGCGKTTVAHLVAEATNRSYVPLSALNAGVKEVRAVIDQARARKRSGGAVTVLFIDEVHRFTKTQQDALLSAVEDRTIVLLAATTENPYFSVVAPLLSRCVLLTLEPLSSTDIQQLLDRAIEDEEGLNSRVELAPDARDYLVRLASGDARKALTALEAAASSAVAAGNRVVDVATAEKALDTAAVRYDRDGDSHYDITSAWIKSMRGSDVDSALHWLARMIVAGEDPRFLARRLVIFASEDIGMADPSALQAATAAMDAVNFVGLPEARLNLAQAVVHLATAPKSNAVIGAIDAAIKDVRDGRSGPVPTALRDSHYRGAQKMGHGAEYRYPHSEPKGIVAQQYAPDSVHKTVYYRPTEHGKESWLAQRLPKLRAIVWGSDGK